MTAERVAHVAHVRAGVGERDRKHDNTTIKLFSAAVSYEVHTRRARRVACLYVRHPGTTDALRRDSCSHRVCTTHIGRNAGAARPDGWVEQLQCMDERWSIGSTLKSIRSSLLMLLSVSVGLKLSTCRRKPKAAGA